MSPIHFDFLEEAMEKYGYHIEVMPSVDNAAIDEGLTYVNNDACYRRLSPPAKLWPP